ncbi:MAG: amidase [Saprospiraceae bacterium]|nr:amidase [Saprospiraceae bacterium]
MQRRKFIRNSTIAGIGLSLASLSSCIYIGRTGRFNVEELSVDQLQQAMNESRVSSVELVKAYLARIGEIDKSGPSLNAVIELNPDAIAIAATLDDERKAGKVRGILHGIPVMLKDNIDTADKMQTTAGALAMEGNVASADAHIVARLREAGAVILGKTNLSEWANFRSTRSASGWSSRGGQTRNPYVTDRSPCGSSSGSAVAVAASLCAVAVGTETDGSIACPASVNGIVGIKPTVGLVSRTGIIPISKTQDTAGPFGRSVRDAVLLLQVLAGQDASDEATAGAQGYIQPDYTRFLDGNALSGKRIGIEKSYLKNHEAVDKLLSEALQTLRDKGAEIVEVEYLAELQKNGDAEFDVLKYEFKDGLNNYLSTSNASVKTLQDVIEFNKSHEQSAMPYFKQEILEASQELGSLSDPAYLVALEKSHLYTQKVLNTLMTDNKLDAVCGPANGIPWCIDPLNGDQWTGYGAYSPAAVAGYPSITVPMGQVDGLPVGLAFFAGAWEEGKLIGLAYAYEQASGKRQKPGFRERAGY